MNKTQIIAIHGGNTFPSYEKYLESLKDRELSLEGMNFQSWRMRLKAQLADSYDVVLPQMPNKQNAHYIEWKIWFEKIVSLLDDSIILVGHSLGGVFLVQYLAENPFPKQVIATMLVAAPYNDATHSLGDFELPKDLSLFEKQAGEIFLYYSKDDAVVPFWHAEQYMHMLPHAHTRVFEDRGHFNNEDFPEIIADICSLTL